MAVSNKPARRYTTEEIERGLWAVALTGSVTRAADTLKAQGHHIPKQTLHKWATTQHADRFQQIRTEASGQIAERIAAEAEAFMLEASRVEKLALEQLEQQIQAGQVKDIASALRNISTAKALNNDKISAPIRGRPTAIVENRDAAQILQELKRLAPDLVIDGEAQET